MDCWPLGYPSVDMSMTSCAPKDGLAVAHRLKCARHRWPPGLNFVPEAEVTRKILSEIVHCRSLIATHTLSPQPCSSSELPPGLRAVRSGADSYTWQEDTGM